MTVGDALVKFLRRITCDGQGWLRESGRWVSAWRIERAARLAREAAHEAFAADPSLRGGK